MQDIEQNLAKSPVRSAGSGSRGIEFLVISRRHRYADSVLACLNARVVVHAGETADSCLAAIVAALAAPDLSALHIVGDGVPGAITVASGATIDSHSARIFFPAVARGAEINLWSNLTGSGVIGRHFVQTLAEITRCRIFASDGLVGGPATGASWDLRIAARPRGLAPFLRPARDTLRL